MGGWLILFCLFCVRAIRRAMVVAESWVVLFCHRSVIPGHVMDNGHPELCCFATAQWYQVPDKLPKGLASGRASGRKKQVPQYRNLPLRLSRGCVQYGGVAFSGKPSNPCCSMEKWTLNDNNNNNNCASPARLFVWNRSVKIVKSCWPSYVGWTLTSLLPSYY